MRSRTPECERSAQYVDVVQDINRTLALAKCTVIQSFLTDLSVAAEGETVYTLDRSKSHFSRVGINRV